MDIEKLRTFCLSLPHVTEDVKWEQDLCFCIGGKIFCITGLDRPFAASMKVSDDDFQELTQREGIIPAPYLARHKWVYMESADKLNEQEWENYVKQAYQLVKNKLPKKILKELE